MTNSYTSCRIVRSDATRDGTSSLAHYGVLGMKWGVRRTPEQLGHRTIPKGTMMYTVKTDDDISPGNIARVAIYKVDRDRQKAISSGNNKREVTYETTAELKAPSRKELNEVIYETMQNSNGLDAIFAGSVAGQKQSISNQKLNDLPFSDRETASKMRDRIASDDTRYDTIVKQMTDNFMSIPRLRESVISELKNRGYNAMVDEGRVRSASRGNYRIGYDPFVVFDPDKNLQETNEQSIGPWRTDRAKNRYEKWSSRANWRFIKNRTTW